MTQLNDHASHVGANDNKLLVRNFIYVPMSHL